MGTPHDNGGESHGKSGEEPSDLFSVGKAATHIPQIKEIPETPEERRRRKIIRIVTAAVAGVVTVTVVLVAIHLWSAAALRSAVLQVSEDGRAASVDEALEHTEADDEPGLRSMVLAIAALELRRSPEPARELVEQMRGGDTVPVAGQVADTYLALHDGQPQRGWKIAGRIVPAGTYAGEAARAVAQAAWAVGNLEQARTSAKVAFGQQPGAPRHAALLALATERVGSDDDALAVLDGLEEEAAASPAVVVARARIGFEPRTDSDEPLEHARAVLEADTATPTEKGWAHLLLGRAAAEQGEGADAVERVEEALGLRSPGDESFTLMVIETLLRANVVDRAAEHWEELPEDVSTAPKRRAQVGGWLALERGDRKTANARLQKAESSPWTVFLRARLHEVQREHDTAARLYRKAAEAPGMLVESYTRLATMQLERGRTGEALQLTEEVLEKAPKDPAAVRVAVQARVANEKNEQAMKLAREALEAHPGDPRLLAARAQVEMAMDQWSKALKTLRAAVDKQPENADLQADLGEAAQRAGEDDLARKAYDKALELAPKHPVALVGRFELAVEGEELELAGELLERIEAKDLLSNRIDRAKARYYVLRSVGGDAVKKVRRAIIRRGKEDPVLWLALGRLQLQAEQHGGAAQAFSRTLSYDEDNLEALVWRTITQVWQRRSAPAENTYEDARELARETEVEPRVEALMLVAEGWLRFADDLWGAAARQARRAIEVDPKCAEAHYLRARVAIERDRDPVEHLRAALKGRAPPPQAKALLVIHSEGTSDELCRLAREYNDAVTGGRHRRSMFRALRECD